MGQWDNLKTGSVAKGLRKGLDGDLTLSHAATVDIIRSTLSNGIVSADELDDLTYVATVSRSMPTRSKALVFKFVAQVQATVGGQGPYRLASDRHVFAADMICDFLQRSGSIYFPHLDRDDVGVRLLMRIAKPSLMNQGAASLCGPTDLLFSLATDKPIEYARFAIDLFEKGKAKLGRLMIEPSKGVRNYAPPAGKIDPADWLTAASLRDSENWWFDYDTVDREVSGITLPGELADWFRRAGYSDVQDETNVYFNKGTGTLDDATNLFNSGYRVCLFINAQMLKTNDQSKSSTIPDHWVVLRSAIDRSGGKVNLKVYSWGDGDYQIPQSGVLSLDDFSGNFYGFVAAKP